MPDYLHVDYLHVGSRVYTHKAVRKITENRRSGAEERLRRPGRVLARRETFRRKTTQATEQLEASVFMHAITRT
eukprot:2574306-Rhodomonas_salina.2